MTDSSTNKPNPDNSEQPKPKTDVKVPVSALADERGKRQAAEAKLANRPQIDEVEMAELMANLVKTAQQEALAAARAEFQKELAPLQRNNAIAQLRADHGLRPEQAEQVLAIQEKYNGMPAAEALALARAGNPAAFQGSPLSTPVGGDSVLRTTAGKNALDMDVLTKQLLSNNPVDRKSAAIAMLGKVMKIDT